MVNISGHYDQNAEPDQFDRIPTGTYRAKIIESEIEEISNKSNKGRCLKLTWQLETGQFDGRLFWQRINMWPENMDNIDRVTTIANSQFAAIRQATGKAAPQDSSELHYIPCMITIGPQKNNPEYDEVKAVKPVAGAQPVQKSTPPPGPTRSAPPASQPQNGGGSAPWRPNRQPNDDIPF